MSCGWNLVKKIEFGVEQEVNLRHQFRQSSRALVGRDLFAKYSPRFFVFAEHNPSHAVRTCRLCNIVGQILSVTYDTPHDSQAP
jgi:hypothetical protein